uniref:Uncharacterized protein n=1 Tax=Peronospora matthiolae TaxID=2874970 RepID=A0AAV1T6D9_9STRA
MRRWAVALTGLAVGGLGLVADGSTATLGLWPQHTDSRLSLSFDSNDSLIATATHGGFLVTYNTKVDVQSEIHLDPLLESIEMKWIPAAGVQSSTFDRFWVNSLRLDGMSVVGIHLQAKLRSGTSWSAITNEHYERVEENIRGILHATFSSIELLPVLSKGFLAKSLCNFRSWRTKNLLQELLQESVTDAPTLCFSSSFPLSLHNKNSAYPDKVIREANNSLGSSRTPVERVLLTIQKIKQDINADQCPSRSIAIKFGRSTASSQMIEAEILDVWVSQSSEAKVPWKTFTPIRKTENGIFVATSVNREMGIDSLECTWVGTSGKLGTPSTALSVVEMQMPKMAVAASLQTTIEGTGFHRRYVTHVELLDQNTCGTGSSNKTILMRVPISSTTYVDLDEIRRMERSGDLKLLSFAKHIDIERPSPISSQHVVGLIFAMPSTGQVHIEFPLHFRYQAPSENKLYRQASVIAPDVFMFCPKEGHSVKRQLKLSDNDATHSYLHTWGLMGQPDPAIANHHWLHLSTSSPLPITQVSIPVGYLPSDRLVSSITLLFASIGAALLCYVSIGASARAPDHFASSWKGKTD